MAIGIRVRNPDGSVQFDSTNRLFRVLTVVDIGSANSGSMAVAGVQGTLGVLATDQSDTGEPPTITRSGNTVSWNYNGVSARRPTQLTMLEY